jgi:hypothetical protein
MRGEDDMEWLTHRIFEIGGLELFQGSVPAFIYRD